MLCEIDVTTHDNGGSVYVCCHLVLYYIVLRTQNYEEKSTRLQTVTLTLENSGDDQASISNIVCNRCLNILSHHHVGIILKQHIQHHVPDV